MGEAARLGDPIVHTSALAGFLVGAVIGVALIAAVAFATFTCGFGVALLAGLVAGLEASAILSISEAIGRSISKRSGQITTGSRNVRINGRPAAFAIESTVACDKHSPVKKVAEGSGNVFYNSLPSARKGDKTTCGATIDDGSQDTFVGGGTVRYLHVDDEVPDWLRTAVDWAFALAGLVGGLAGLVKAAGGLSRAVLPCAAKFIGGFVLGEAASRMVIGPVVQRAFGGLFGRPVDVTTGRKLLLATDELDFVLQSPVPLECGRFYASNLTRIGALGQGWVLPWELRLQRRDGRLWLLDAQGRESGFPDVPAGHSVFHEAEQKYLSCTATGRYILHDLSETYFDFGEMPAGVADDTALLQRIEDGCGQWISFQRAQGSEQVRLVMTSGGQQLRLSYLHMKGRLTEIELVHQRDRRSLVKYGYDAQGQLMSVTDARGEVVRRFEYLDGLMCAHTNALGLTCRYVWQSIEGQPRVTEVSTSEGERACFTYDIAARKTAVVDELGRHAQWTYDAHFQVTECIDLDGKRYRTEYNTAGWPTAFELPAEEEQPRRVELDFDDAGRIVAETDVLGRTTTTRYHRDSLRPEAIRQTDGSEWTADYDRIGRLLKTTNPLGHTEHYEYAAGSLSPWPQAVIDAKGGRKTMQWSRAGWLMAYTDCSGKTTRYDYDVFGHMVSMTNALEQTSRIQREPTGQAVRVELPDGSEEHFEHDAAGLLRAYHDRAGHTRHWERNARGQVVKATDPAGRKLLYHYDPQGRLVRLASASGAYGFEYDAGDRLLGEMRPDGVRRRLRYGAYGQLVALQEVGTTVAADVSLQRTTAFEHDAAGRMLARHNETSTTRYAWDDGDRLVQAVRQPSEVGLGLGVNASTVSFKYDASGRLIAEQGRDGLVAYELDELSHLTALKLPNEQRIDFLSYGSGHVHQVRCGDQLIADIERDDLHREVLRTQGRLTLGLGYDALGRRTWQSAAGSDLGRPPALAPAQGKLWRTYRYSAEGELAEQTDSTRGALQYQYDPAGQMLQRSHPDGRTGLEQFAWDAAGNLLDDVQRKSGGRVKGNRLITWQDIRFEYDAWGNLHSKRSGQRQLQHFTFDADNRLLTVKTEARGETIHTRFEYDALGRRIARQDHYTDLSEALRRVVSRRFVWQGLRMVQELRETGLSNYIYSPDGAHTPMARVDQYIGPVPLASGMAAAVETDRAIANAKVASARTYHFHTDLVGAPLEVTDEQGELVWSGEYTAWGRVQTDTQRALEARIEQALRYPGQYADDSTGLHYNTFRYYDPDVGRFISHDPIGLAGGENLYGYAPNPTGWLDPLGWMPWAWNPSGMGHHLIPRNKANSIGLHELGTGRNTPSFFPDPYEAGMHEELHRAIKGDIGKLQGPWAGTAEELFEASSKGLDAVSHVKGDLRIPATGEVIASNVTPKQAHAKLVDWFKSKRGGGC